jgi:hypothetical protein
MSDTIPSDLRQVWARDPEGMAPLPALLDSEHKLSVYDLRVKKFGRAGHTFSEVRLFDTFEECRAAMVQENSRMLKEQNAACRRLARSIEHLKTIPASPFPQPSVIPEVSEPQEEDQAKSKEAQGERKKTEADLKRPAPRKTTEGH